MIAAFVLGFAAAVVTVRWWGLGLTRFLIWYSPRARWACWLGSHDWNWYTGRPGGAVCRRKGCGAVYRRQEHVG